MIGPAEHGAPTDRNASAQPPESFRARGETPHGQAVHGQTAGRGRHRPIATWPGVSAARSPPVGAAQAPAHDRKRIAPNTPSKRTHPPGIRPDSAVEPAAS
jgi:hypothetical protein